MDRLKSFALTACTLLGLLVPLGASSPAWAICDADHTIYEFKNVTTTDRATNIAGDWMEAGMTASYSKSATATLSASMTATVSAEAGIVFAKASASLGVTVGGSYARTQTWTYTSRPVPSGKEGRLVMYHEGRRFTVVKKVLRSPCTYVQVYAQTVDAPIKSGGNFWKLQLRNAHKSGAQHQSGADIGDGGVTEIDEGPAVDAPDGVDDSGAPADDGSGGLDGAGNDELAPADEPETLGSDE